MKPVTDGPGSMCAAVYYPVRDFCRSCTSLSHPHGYVNRYILVIMFRLYVALVKPTIFIRNIQFCIMDDLQFLTLDGENSLSSEQTNSRHKAKQDRNSLFCVFSFLLVMFYAL